MISQVVSVMICVVHRFFFEDLLRCPGTLRVLGLPTGKDYSHFCQAARRSESCNDLCLFITGEGLTERSFDSLDFELKDPLLVAYCMND